MRSILRNTAIHTASLYAVNALIAGMMVAGGLQTFLISGFVLTILGFLLKPILNIVAFPLNLVTMGLFSIVTNCIILLILTLLVPQITIHPFVFPGTNILGIILPRISFNTFFAFVVTSITLSFIEGGIKWLIKS